MSLRDLDAFLEHARRTPELQSQLNGPLELEALLELAAAEGYPSARRMCWRPRSVRRLS